MGHLLFVIPSKAFEPFSTLKIERYLIEYIGHAFRGVSLDCGRSIYAAQSLECYGDANEDRLDRSAERFDWRRVPAADLVARDQAIHFLDDAGFRFYTPAIMTIIVGNTEGCENLADTFEFTLSGIRSSCRVRDLSYCEVFNAAQRAAITRYVKFLIHNVPGSGIDEGLTRAERRLPECCRGPGKTG